MASSITYLINNKISEIPRDRKKHALRKFASEEEQKKTAKKRTPTKYISNCC